MIQVLDDKMHKLKNTFKFEFDFLYFFLILLCYSIVSGSYIFTLEGQVFWGLRMVEGSLCIITIFT